MYRFRMLFSVLVLAGLYHPGQLQGQSTTSITGARVNCENGLAAGSQCQNVDLLSVLRPADIGTAFGGELNDIWGWSDTETGREFALVGRTDGTAFVEVTDPVNPRYVGQLLHNGVQPSAWRDMKVYGKYAYIVADGTAGNGMQIFDLSQLLTVTGAPVTFTATGLYTRFKTAHNIVINEESGFAYAVGARASDPTQISCDGGLHMIDLSNPLDPTFAGCFAHVGTGRRGAGYTHDAQCVIYNGRDIDFTGREICFGSNETHISIADVTDRGNPRALASATYPSAGYIHQGWLTEDHRYFVSDDELDELAVQNNAFVVIAPTRTFIWDVGVLEDPQLVAIFQSTTMTNDHNLYVKGNLVYQSNYIGGFRMLDISDPINPREVAWFDMHDGEEIWGGSWSNYPFFNSGAIAVTSSTDGLFLLAPDAALQSVATESDELPSETPSIEAFPNPFSGSATLRVHVPNTQHVKIVVYDMLGREVEVIFDGTLSSSKDGEFEFHGGNLSPGTYYYRASGDTFSMSRPITLLR